MEVMSMMAASFVPIHASWVVIIYTRLKVDPQLAMEVLFMELKEKTGIVWRSLFKTFKVILVMAIFLIKPATSNDCVWYLQD